MMGVQQQGAEAGFTLLEVLIVLAILALVMSLAGPVLTRVPDGVRLQTVSDELAAALRMTRSAAVTHQSETTLIVDADQRAYGSEVVPKRTFSTDIVANLRFAAGIGASHSNGGFHFFPDGSSTGGNLVLMLHEKQASICVDWLTGAISQRQVC